MRPDNDAEEGRSMQSFDRDLFVIGAGSMAEAFIRGVTERGAVNPSRIRVLNRSNVERPRHLAEQYGVRIARGWDEIAHSKYVFVAVKPNDVASALQSCLPHLHGQCVISFAAGVPLEYLERMVHGRVEVVRTMPNIPVAVGSGVTAVTWGENVGPQEREEIRYLLSQLGSVVEIEETLMDAATALTGSGPGFVSYFLESMENAAVQIGFSPELARKLLIDTVLGTAKTLAEWGLSPKELREKVTSPNGTTHAGVSAMQQDHLGEAILHALQSATVRSKEIARMYKSV
jgi:pyrroline-5-carboxylate reductase